METVYVALQKRISVLIRKESLIHNKLVTIAITILKELKMKRKHKSIIIMIARPCFTRANHNSFIQ